MPLEPEAGTNRDYTLRHALARLEEERIRAGIYSCYMYACIEGLPEEEEFGSLIEDEKLNRRSGQIESIKANPDLAYEYYDEDKDNDIYPFDKEYERKLLSIKRRLLKFIAFAIKNQERNPLDELWKE